MKTYKTTTEPKGVIENLLQDKCNITTEAYIVGMKPLDDTIEIEVYFAVRILPEEAHTIIDKVRKISIYEDRGVRLDDYKLGEDKEIGNGFLIFVANVL